MVHRNKLLLLLAVGIFLLSACEKEKSPVKPITNGPALWVNKSEVQLSGNPWRDMLLISNIGKGTLEWYVESTPSWVSVSRDSGFVFSDTTFISLFTDFSQLEYGEHSGTMVIKSNGGEFDVQLNLVYNAPVLQIEEDLFNMDRYEPSKTLTITNTGGGELHWRVADIPPWLTTNTWEGGVTGSQSVVFWVDFSKIPYGYYEDELKIESDGGEWVVVCLLLYQREIEIFPGQGAALINIGDTVKMLKNQWGDPTSNGYNRPEHTVFEHFLVYSNLGLTFWFVATQPTLWDNVDCNMIEMYAPYDGMTEEGLGINSTFDEIKAVYGEPNSYDSENDLYVYDIGIKFKIQNNRVVRILIGDLE